MHTKANLRSMVAKRSKPPRQLHTVPLMWLHTIINQAAAKLDLRPPPWNSGSPKFILWWPPAYINGGYLLRKMVAMSVHHLASYIAT